MMTILFSAPITVLWLLEVNYILICAFPRYNPNLFFAIVLIHSYTAQHLHGIPNSITFESKTIYWTYLPQLCNWNRLKEEHLCHVHPLKKYWQKQ
jgi:hypothetical protein